MNSLSFKLLAAFASLLCAFLSQTAPAQDNSDPDPSERTAVLAVIQQFFDTMAAEDVEGAKQTVISEGRFYSVRYVDGRQVVGTFTNQEYLDGIPVKRESVRERMWDPTVHIRGDIASVWTPYDFWIDGKFSHCGIDSFALVKSEGKWKISGGAYTVERECSPSPLGPLKK